MKITFIFVLFNIALWLGGCQSVKEGPKNIVIAKYSGSELTSSQLTEEIKKNSPSLLTDSLITEEQIKDFVSRFIDYKIKVADGYSRGFGTDADLLAEFKTYKNSLATARIVDGQIKKDLIDELYERKKYMMSASHILITVLTGALPADTAKAYFKAMDIKRSILAGSNFEDAAVQHSEDPSAKQNKGALGWFSGGDMVYPFEQAVYNNKIGDIVGPVRTQFGFHILKITGKKETPSDREISHIMIQTRPGMDTLAQMKKADSIITAIRNGAEFAALASTLSDDGRTKAQNGFIGVWKPTGRVPEFDKLVYDGLTKVGQISDVVRTKWGYHIVRLEKITAARTKEDQMEELTTAVNRQNDRIESRKSIFVKDLYGKLQLKINEALMTELVKSIKGLKEPKGPEETAVLPDSSNILKSAVGLKTGETIVSGKNTGIVLEPFLVKNLKSFPELSGSSDENVVRQDVKKLLDNYIYDYYIENLDAYDPGFKELLGSYMDGLVLFKWLESVIWKVDQPADSVLQPIYDETKAEYMWPERAKIMFVRFDNFKKADSLITVKKSKTLDDITKLMKKNKINMTLDTVLVTQSENEAVSKIWDLKTGELSLKGISYNGSNVYPMVLSKIPVTQKTLDEARSEVFRKYYDRTVKIREESFIADLRSKAAISVDDLALKQFVAQYKK